VEVVRCIDNSGNEKALVIGKNYGFKNLGDEFVSILDESGQYNDYCVEAFEFEPQVKKVTSEEATIIIETRKPLGLFYTIEKGSKGNIYIGIDNDYGDAWTEEFKNLNSCKRWLRGYVKKC